MIPPKQLISLADTITLDTERLHLRRYRATDLDEEIRQQQDPEVVRFIREPMSNEEVVAFFEQFIRPYQAEEREWLGLCVERHEDGRQIGAISFRLESVEFGIFEIGYRFNREFQGKGYALEAVKAMVAFLIDSVKAHKIIACCDPENVASYRLMEKLGMQREGCLRSHYKVGDRWCDMLLYGLLSDS